MKPSALTLLAMVGLGYAPLGMAFALPQSAPNQTPHSTPSSQFSPFGEGKEQVLLPPTQPDAGGDNLPNIGMHALKKVVAGLSGKLPSNPISMLPGTIAPVNPVPLGWPVVDVNLYLPDFVDPSNGTQADQDALFLKIAMDRDEYFPETFWFGNSDPSGSLDRSALDADGEPIHYNLHWPPDSTPDFWLDERGYDASAPTDDLEAILNEILSTGSTTRIPEALDILLGTNDSGALSRKVYQGFPLLKYKGATDNRTFDEETRNVEVTQLWYGTEIVSDSHLLMVPTDGDYTITWKLRGLGDIGPNRERAFPIDEFSAMPMKKTSNSDFWRINSWIWKWFDSIEAGDRRRFALETLYELHTGTEAAPSYSELNPGDPRYWLHADRKFHMGSYVGEGDLENFLGFHSYDLDLDGQIGGFLVDGTDTGLAYDVVNNPDAQFNAYGNNEYSVPRIDWAEGPPHVPYFGYDSSFTTIRKGEGIDLTVRYSQGEMQAGLYNWGWRVHPPRINWIETYSDGQILASGAPKQWRFKHKWDEVAELGLDALGDFAPEKRIYQALLTYQTSTGSPTDLSNFATEIDGLMKHVRDRRGLPPTPGLIDFPNPNSDVNLLYTNLDMYGDRDTISAAGKLNWREGDTITFTIHNDDEIERYFRVVDFGTTDYQYNGLDMGRFDWKPVFGFPQLAAKAWTPELSVNFGFGPQGQSPSFWTGTELEGSGNPFYVSAQENDPDNFWWAGERDLSHNFTRLSGFSGPGFTSETGGDFGAWSNDNLAGLATGDSNLWRYSYGKPIPPNTTVTFTVEMPRAAALNNGAMYIFDPQFHASSIFTMHPTAEVQPEGLDD